MMKNQTKKSKESLAVKRKIAVYLLILFSIIIPTAVFSQLLETVPGGGIQPVELTADLIAGFAFAVIAGLVLSIGIQFLLTNLSVAVGLNLLSPVTQPKSEAEKKEAGSTYQERNLGKSMQMTIRNISTGFGIWTLVTSSISLFFGVWAAVRLSPTTVDERGALLGLITWGLFVISIVALDTMAVSSMLGGLTKLVGNSVKSVYEASAMLFSVKPDVNLKDIFSNISDTVRQEFIGDIQDFRERIRGYVDQLKPSQHSPEIVSKYIQNSLNENELSVLSSVEGGDLLLSCLVKDGRLPRESAQQVVEDIYDVYSLKARGELGAKTKAEEVQAIKNTVEMKIKKYFDTINRPELRYEGIKNDIMRLLYEPGSAVDSLMRRLQAIDRDMIKTIVISRQDISGEDAEFIIQQFETVRNNALQKTNQMKEEINRRYEQAKIEVLYQADETRRTAAIAAWWVFASVVVSAAAAVLGGILGA